MKRLLLTTMLGLQLALDGTVAAAQTISDRIRDPSRTPGTPVVIGVLGEPIPLSVEELTKRSDLVLEAKVSRLKTRINAADTAVFTDFALLPIRILAGSVPGETATPGVAIPLVLTSYGGEVVRDGVTIRAENHDLKPIRDGGAYLLFLKKSFDKVPGVYQIYNAAVFELSDNSARPLAMQGANLYRDFSSNTYGEVVTRVVAAARAR